MKAVNFVRPLIVLALGSASNRAVLAQCSPYVPPSQCAVAPSLMCPQSLNGDFCNGEPWYLGPGGLPGVLPSGNQLQIDQTCDGDAIDLADATFNVPASITQAVQNCPTCNVEYRLSPSQEVLYARVSSAIQVPGCAAGQSRIFFFALGPEPNLIPFSGVHQGTCMNHPAIPPLFYDQPGDPIRTAVVVGTAGVGIHQPVFWADLVNRQVNLDAGRYGTGIQIPQFSQRGNAVFLLSLSGGFSTGYALVDLCRSPIAAGDAVGFGTFALGTTGVTAEMTGSTGNRNVVITRSTGAPIVVPMEECLCGACCDAACVDDVAVTDCGDNLFDELCAENPCGGPAQEACCLSDGACASLVPAGCTAAGGTSQGAGSTCLVVVCAPETESCCIAGEGQCVEMDPDVCTANGNTPGGPGSDCAAPNCPAPPGTEGCCLPNGACVNLPPVGGFFSCLGQGGSPQGAGTNCLNGTVICPSAALSIIKSGPASVPQGSTFSYTITYGNAGPSDAHGVQVRETIPAGVSFVSASNTPAGDAPTVAAGVITWPVGTLPAGTVGQQVTVTFRALCSTSQINNSSYQISGMPGGTVSGTVVVTAVTSTVPDPVQMAVSSIDLNGSPLKEGELIEHTITLTNTAAVDRASIFVRSGFGGDFGVGDFSEFGSVVNDGGGQFVIGANNVFLHWVGSIPASATVEIVFQTRVSPCVPVGVGDVILNRGEALSVRDGCNRQLGTATPVDRFTVQRRVSGRTVATNLYRPKSGAGFFFSDSQVARRGSVIQFETALTTDESMDVTNVSVSQRIPSELMVVDPPFVGTPPAGTSYDSVNRLIQFNGTIPAAGSVIILWEAVLDPGNQCRTIVDLFGGTAECTGSTMNISQNLNIFVVPDVPTDPYLVTLDGFRGLSIMAPGVDVETRDLLCKHGEIYTGVTQTASGELWVSGLPTLRFDPVNLECEVYLEDFFVGILGMPFGPHTSGVCFDRFSDTIIFTGPGATGGRVMRYDPMTEASTLIIEDGSIAPGGCVVDQEGHVVVNGGGGLYRIDPANPGALQTFLTSSMPFPAGVPMSSFVSILDTVVDVDGNYLMTMESAWLVGNSLLVQRWLAKLDRLTGVYSIVVDNLRTLHPGITGPDRIFAIAVAPNGSYYFAQRTYPDRIYRSDRACGNHTMFVGIGGESHDVFFSEFVTIYDMVYSEPVTAIGPVPTTLPGDVDDDCLITHADHAAFADCMNGPDMPPAPGAPMTAQECLDVFDIDGDGDVDMDDAAELERRFTG